MGFFQLEAPLFITFSFAINLIEMYENILVEYILVLLTKKKNKERVNSDVVNNEFPIYYGFRGVGFFFGQFFGGG